MKEVLTHRTHCRLCNSKRVEKVVELKPIPLSENYSHDQNEAKNTPRFPIDVYMCADCGHVQQLDVIDPEFLWASYTYFSGTAKGIPEHFDSISKTMIRKAAAPKNALAVDIGSNDGSLLKRFKDAGFRVIGVDPAIEATTKANAAGIPTLTSLMTRDVAKKILAEHGPAHVMSAFNVFGHTDDLGEMADCIRILLHDDGLFFFEAQYLIDIVDRVLLATIFHEHMSHHSVLPLMQFLEAHDLELIDAERADIQHGSLIGTVQVKGGKRQVEGAIHDLVALEKRRRLNEISTIREFDAKVQELRKSTASLVEKLKKQGKSIAGYGAARSGPTLIIQLGLEGALDFIVDDHPQKVGKYENGDGVMVMPTAELLKRMPDYTAILAWVHAQKIVENNREYLEKGGHFIVLCPETRIVGKDGDVKF